jgi:hypothetical protein
MPDETPTQLELLEQRVAQLEMQLGTRSKAAEFSYSPLWPALLICMAIGFGFLGIGIPNHFYQPVFAVLVSALLYHRELISLYESAWRWIMVTLNLLVMTLFFRLIIGGGEARPFAWLKLPGLEKQPAEDDASWLDKMAPDYDLVWREAATADWSFNITQIQTVLLLATLIGGLFRFQPFASIAAIVLLLVSVPAFLIYDWNWVILFMITGSTGLYLQTQLPNK